MVPKQKTPSAGLREVQYDSRQDEAEDLTFHVAPLLFFVFRFFPVLRRTSFFRWKYLLLFVFLHFFFFLGFSTVFVWAIEKMG